MRQTAALEISIQFWVRADWNDVESKEMNLTTNLEVNSERDEMNLTAHLTSNLTSDFQRNGTSFN